MAIPTDTEAVPTVRASSESGREKRGAKAAEPALPPSLRTSPSGPALSGPVRAGSESGRERPKAAGPALRHRFARARHQSLRCSIGRAAGGPCSPPPMGGGRGGGGVSGAGPDSEPAAALAAANISPPAPGETSLTRQRRRRLRGEVCVSRPHSPAARLCGISAVQLPTCKGSPLQPRGHNSKLKVHNQLYFYCLRTKSLVEKLRGALLQPVVRTVQVAILIRAAYSRSFRAAAFHRFTQLVLLKAGSHA